MCRLLERLCPAFPSTRQLAKRLGVSHTAIANKLREYGIGKVALGATCRRAVPCPRGAVATRGDAPCAYTDGARPSG